MQNIQVEVKGTKVILTIDASQDLGRSRSGKSVLIATSGGNQPVQVGDTTAYLGLNFYRK